MPPSAPGTATSLSRGPYRRSCPGVRASGGSRSGLETTRSSASTLPGPSPRACTEQARLAIDGTGGYDPVQLERGPGRGPAPTSGSTPGRGRGRYNRACAVLVSMAGILPPECPPGEGDAAFWTRRGMACTRRRRYATAIESFEQALTHDPGSVEALLGRGNALYALERHDEALAAVRPRPRDRPRPPGGPPRPREPALGPRPDGGGFRRVRAGDGPPPPPRTGVIYRTSARTPNRSTMTEGYPTATVEGREVPYDPSTLRRIQEHPCFSEKACHAFGRMHLAVAPKCNIQCNYCQRDYDCVNESRPGVTSRIVTPEEAVALVKQVLEEHKFIKVIGIAGPGDPLANEQTFEALRLIKEHFPETIRCISTNGLILPERIDELADLDVGNLTVTMNALDPEVGAKIYDHIDYHGKRYTGVEGAKILIANQAQGGRGGREAQHDRQDQHGLGPRRQRRPDPRDRRDDLEARRVYLQPDPGHPAGTSSRTSCPRRRPRSARCRTGARRSSSRCATASAAARTRSACSATISRPRAAAAREPEPVSPVSISQRFAAERTGESCTETGAATCSPGSPATEKV